MSKKALLDADGCLRQSSGAQAVPHPPPREVREVLCHLASKGVRIALTTGQPICNARVTEGQIGDGFRFSRMFVDNAGLEVGEDGARFLVPPTEMAALATLAPGLSELLTRFDGVRDVRDVRAMVNYFFRSREAFEAANALVDEFLDRPEYLGHKGQLKVQWNRIDRSMNLMPASSSKGLAVTRVSQINVASGDGTADLPHLKASRFAILTSNDGVPNPVLVKAMLQRPPGSYYIATERHGYGLAAGILAARDAGFLLAF